MNLMLLLNCLLFFGDLLFGFCAVGIYPDFITPKCRKLGLLVAWVLRSRHCCLWSALKSLRRNFDVARCIIKPLVTVQTLIPRVASSNPSLQSSDSFHGWFPLVHWLHHWFDDDLGGQCDAFSQSFLALNSTTLAPAITNRCSTTLSPPPLPSTSLNWENHSNVLKRLRSCS